jgi:hypothetical protein
MGSKMTMEQYGKLAAGILNIPRKQRDMLARALEDKRREEDAKKAIGKAAHEAQGVITGPGGAWVDPVGGTE